MTEDEVWKAVTVRWAQFMKSFDAQGDPNVTVAIRLTALLMAICLLRRGSSPEFQLDAIIADLRALDAHVDAHMNERTVS
jgi:hypothetical protein